MKFLLEIRCDNAAFTDESGDDEPTIAEVARILEVAAKRLQSAGVISTTELMPLVDMNGNRVGHFEFEDD